MKTLDPWAIALDRHLDPPAPVDEGIETDPLDWLRLLFPLHVAAPMGPHHAEFWAWLWGIQTGAKPAEAFVGIWPRGGAKSTSAELAVVALGARRRRRYCLYVCETQDQADDHVGNIAGLLESRAVERHYPSLADRALSKYGNSKGWRHNRLRTAAGFTVDALGLDSAGRGVKLDEQRPDLMVFDDLDGEDDTPRTTDRKIATLTKKLMPAGSNDVAFLAIQNLVHRDSIFARLADGRADFLGSRHVSGPVLAVEGLVVDKVEQTDGSQRFTILDGAPTWAGQDLDVCQAQIDDWGYSAFIAEAQHDTTPPAGGMWNPVTFEHRTAAEVPDLVNVVVWVDPAVTDTDQSDAMGIQADGIDADGRIWRLYSWEERTSPEAAIRRAIRCALRLGASHVGVETDQGGDTWRSVCREAARAVALEDGVDLDAMPSFVSDKAGAKTTLSAGGHGHGSKVHRSSLMLADYERPGRVLHVVGEWAGESTGVDMLERGLRRFPGTKPFDLVDAAYWSWADLRGRVKRPKLTVRNSQPKPVEYGVVIYPETPKPRRGGMRVRGA